MLKLKLETSGRKNTAVRATLSLLGRFANSYDLLHKIRRTLPHPMARTAVKRNRMDTVNNSSRQRWLLKAMAGQHDAAKLR